LQVTSAWLEFGSVIKWVQLHLRSLKIEPKTGHCQNPLHPLQPTKHIGVSVLAPQPPYGIICLNNPLIYVDPSGNFFIIDDIIAGITALVSAITASSTATTAVLSIAGGAALGAGVSAATGGNIWQGALTGGILELGTLVQIQLDIDKVKR
jgi:hypothetical protein